MCFVVIVLGKAVYFFSPLPLSKSRLAVKQLTPPAAPASATPLSSASIAPSSLSLNLLPINPPSQTGDSNLVADKTIDSSHKEKVLQQKARRHALASPTLVASDEMTPLEPADRHPAPSQKLPTSKQPTPPAAPASAPPLSSASIAPNPLFLYLLPRNPPSQTGDLNLVADKTIDSSHKEVVPQQQGHSLLPLPVDGSGQPLLSQESTPSPTVQVLIVEDGEKAVFEGQNMPLQEIAPPLQHSFLPIPIDGSGQPLRSQESTSSFTVQVPIDEVGKEAVLEGQNMSLDMDSFRSRSCISRRSLPVTVGGALHPVVSVDQRSRYRVAAASRGQWHPSHYSVSSPSPFFSLFSLLPRQALGRASFLLAWTL